MKSKIFSDNYILYFLFFQAKEALQNAREKELEQYGLSQVEIGIMIYISIIDSTTGNLPTVTELAQWLFRKHNSVSELVSRMEKKGLLRRIREGDSTKNIQIAITEEGLKRCQKAVTESNLIENAFSSLSKEERSWLWVIMGKLRNHMMDEMNIEDKPPFPKFIG